MRLRLARKILNKGPPPFGTPRTDTYWRAHRRWNRYRACIGFGPPMYRMELKDGAVTDQAIDEFTRALRDLVLDAVRRGKPPWAFKRPIAGRPSQHLLGRAVDLARDSRVDALCRDPGATLERIDDVVSALANPSSGIPIVIDPFRDDPG